MYLLDIRYVHFKKLNYLNNHNNLFILLCIPCLFQMIIFFQNYQLGKVEQDELYNQTDKIEKCIDIENKNKRTIYENIKLSEYCIDNFGTMKSFK